MKIDQYLKPPKIIEKIIKRKWWFDKIEYYVEWEFCCIGPYKSYDDAHDMIVMYNYAIKS